MSSHAPLHFDLSIFDVFGAAASGAALVLVPKRASVFPVELTQFVQAARLTVWYSVPSVLTLLLRRGGLSDDGAFAELRLVLFAGEVFPSAQIRALMSALPTARFVNLYGPTETNVCTWQEVLQPPATDEPIPIGRAIPGVAATAWTDDGRVAEVGQVGELVISGPTVMRGYWNDPKRTSEVLKRSPAGSEWAQAYLTGDLVRRLNDGVFAFIGRRDHQVKTRGYRVELGEVEAALRANPAVRDCAVVATPDDLVGSRLVACVVVEAPADARTLARACRELLPAYMVPDRFEIVDEMPRTSTDKTDRRALVERYTN